MSALPLPIQHAQDVVEAVAHDTPVIVFCMSCSRSKKQDPYLIANKLGPVPFGFLMNAFICKQCSERLAVVLPWYAPTPREWVKIARPLEKRAPIEDVVRVDGKAFAYRIDIWKSDRSDITRVLACIDNLHMGRAAFDVALREYPREEITMSQGAQLLGDSRRRDVKPVK